MYPLTPLGEAPQRPVRERVSASHRAILHSLSTATALVTLLIAARSAGACPDCAVGRQARAQLWTDDFGLNLVLALVPFLIIGAVSLWANRIGRAADPPTAARRASTGATASPT